jgi:hypothetical protein
MAPARNGGRSPSCAAAILNRGQRRVSLDALAYPVHVGLPSDRCRLVAAATEVKGQKRPCERIGAQIDFLRMYTFYVQSPSAVASKLGERRGKRTT